MIELMRRVGFPPFKRTKRAAATHLSAHRLLRRCSEPLEAKVLLAGDTISVAIVDGEHVNVIAPETFSILNALSRGGDELMAHAGLPAAQAPLPAVPAVTPPAVTPPAATPQAASDADDLRLQNDRIDPGEADSFSGVLAAAAEGEPGDVTMMIGDGIFVIYNSNTGEIRVDSSKNLSSVEVKSRSGILTGSPAANLGGSFDVDTDIKIFKATAFTTGGSPLGFGSLSFGTVAQSGLSDDFVRNDLTISGSVVPRGSLSSKAVGVEVFASDLNGNRITELSFGQEFELRATVKDIRATAIQEAGDVGVFAVYFDVEWDSNLAQALGEPIFSDNFTNARSGTVGNGLIDEVGAVSASTTPTDTSTKLLFSQRMVATLGGQLQFSLNPADLLPQHETLLFGGTSSIPDHEIGFDDDAVINISDSPTDIDLAAFAQDLADAGAVMYGAGWCPSCTEQKELFGDGQVFLPFVEVTNPDRTPNDIATENNISSFPTWVFSDNSRLIGVQSLETLAQSAGISIPESNLPITMPLEDADLLSGSPLHIALDGYDPNGGPLTYTVTSDNPDVQAELLTGRRSMLIDVQGFGNMLFRFFEDEAPRVVERIGSLADDGFYDNLTFHRILNDFVIQGGDPLGNGSGGSELSDFDDQYDVDLQHNVTGLLSMAKTNDDTNNSQFFITETPSRHLDFNHSIFGFLVEGESNRDNISNVDVAPGGVPTIPVTMESVTTFDDLENGVLRLSSPEGSSGVATITVTVSDAEGHEHVQSFEVDVSPDTDDGGPFLEDIPELITPGNTPLTFQLSAIDVEGDPVRYSGSTTDPNITMEVNEETGDVTITPIPGFVGTATAIVRVTAVNRSDTQDLFDSQQITIQVVPDAPTVDLLDVSDSGVSSTDNITNATELQFQVDGVANGAEVSVRADGQVIGQTTASGSTVTITTSDLAALGDGPYAITSIQTVDGQSSEESVAFQLILDQTDPSTFDAGAPTDGLVNELIVFDIDHPEEGTNGLRYSLERAPAGAAIDADSGEFSWTPAPGQSGISAFDVVVTDAAGNRATDAVSIDVDSLEVMSVRLLVTDSDGNPISAIAVGQSFDLRVFVEDLRGPSDDLRGVFAAYIDVNFNGTLIAVDGDIEYGPDFNNAQFGDTSTSGLIDDAGATAGSEPLGLGEFLLMSIPMVGLSAGEVDFTADGADELPLLESLLNGATERVSEDQFIFGDASVNVVDMTFAVDDHFDLIEDSVDVALRVLDNDVAVPETADLTITDVGTPANGTVRISADGQELIYTPDADFQGVDSFSYTIEGDGGETSTAIVTLQIEDVNDDPIAVDDNISVAEDSIDHALNVLLNDSTGPDVGESLQITNVDINGNGVVRISPDGGSLIYTPVADFSGTETIVYTVSDGRGGSDTAEVTVTVTPVNDAPLANRDIRTMNEDGVLLLDVSDLLGNDSAGASEEGQTLTIVGVAAATDGTVELNGSTITFTPPSNFFGTVAFEYTVQDDGTTNGNADPQTAVGIVTINVNNVNDDPTAVDDQAIAQSGGGRILINVLGNDTDAPDTGESLSVIDVGETSNDGTVAITADGEIEYTPADGFSGTETFTYTLSDGHGGQATATVTVVVQNFVPGGISGNVVYTANGATGPANSLFSLTGLGIKLEGVDAQGNAIALNTRTDAFGFYAFDDLAPGTYKIAQTESPFTINGMNAAVGDGAANVLLDGDLFQVELSASGLGDTQLNFTEGGLKPQFSIWEALSSGGGDGLYSSVHEESGQQWTQSQGGWDGSPVTDVSFNEAMTRVTITIVENGQTLQTTIPRSDRSRIQVIGQEGQSHLVRIRGARSDFDFSIVES